MNVPAKSGQLYVVPRNESMYTSTSIALRYTAHTKLADQAFIDESQLIQAPIASMSPAYVNTYQYWSPRIDPVAQDIPAMFVPSTKRAIVILVEPIDTATSLAISYALYTLLYQRVNIVTL